MTAQIETFRASDYEDAIALWRACEGVGLSDADEREPVTRFLAYNAGLSFVARREGALVGAVLCGTDGRRGYLHHLAVTPAERRQGTGTALAARCLGELRQRGIDRCHVFVLADNADARRFWERTGWKLRTDLVVLSKDTAAPQAA